MEKQSYLLGVATLSIFLLMGFGNSDYKKAYAEGYKNGFDSGYRNGENVGKYLNFVEGMGMYDRGYYDGFVGDPLNINHKNNYNYEGGFRDGTEDGEKNQYGFNHKYNNEEK